MPYPQALILFVVIFEPLNLRTLNPEPRTLNPEPRTRYGYIKINKILQCRQGQLKRCQACTHLLQIFDKNVIELQKTMRVFCLVMDNPTAEGIAVAAIIRLFLYYGTLS